MGMMGELAAPKVATSAERFQNLFKMIEETKQELLKVSGTLAPIRRNTHPLNKINTPTAKEPGEATALYADIKQAYEAAAELRDMVFELHKDILV